jgi:hypothetical protein
LKSTGAQAPWGFESLALRHLRYLHVARSNRCGRSGEDSRQLLVALQRAHRAEDVAGSTHLEVAADGEPAHDALAIEHHGRGAGRPGPQDRHTGAPRPSGASRQGLRSPSTSPMIRCRGSASIHRSMTNVGARRFVATQPTPSHWLAVAVQAPHDDPRFSSGRPRRLISSEAAYSHA